MLSLPREKAGRLDPTSTRLQHSLRLPSDYRNMEEREQQAPLAAQPPSAQTGTLFSSQAPTLVPIPYPQPRVPHGSHFPSFLGLCLWEKHTLNPTCSICFIPGPWSSCRCRASNLMLHPLADAALKRLASLLASYGLGLPELSPQQISSLSTLLQLLQSSGELGAGMGQTGAASSRCYHALFQGRECCLLGWVL